MYSDPLLCYPSLNYITVVSRVKAHGCLKFTEQNQGGPWRSHSYIHIILYMQTTGSLEMGSGHLLGTLQYL